MKTLFSLLLIVVCSTANLLHAQTPVVKNQGGQVVKKLTTTNATATAIDAIPIADGETGVLSIQVVGFAADSSAGVTGIVAYRYTKTAGTLTLSSVTNVQSIVADTKVSGATFAAVAASNNIELRVTGKASVKITWYSIVKQVAIKKE